MPEAVPRQPRRDDTSADARSLEHMGRLNPQPAPTSLDLQPAPSPDDAAEEAALTEALTDAGVAATAEDHAAIEALAKLDATTVEAVTRWLTAKKPKPGDEK